MAQGQTTPEKTLSNPWSGKGFCDPHQYKSAIDRAEGGYKSCELGIEMFKRLHKITEQYSAAIREWSTSSQKQIAESKESGTTRKAWLECVRTVEKLAEHNDHIADGIQKKVVEKMTKFKTEDYGKSFIHVKKIKDFEHDFKKIQKPWLEFLDKINDAKQAYHDSTRKLRHAEAADRIIQSDVGSTDDQKKKVKTSVEKRKSDTKDYEEKYQRLISDSEKRRESYEKDMFDILARTDAFERKRLEHFHSMFDALKDATLVDNKEHNDKLVTKFNEAIEGHKIDADIDFFHKHYGNKTESKWPVFEDLKE